MKIHIVKQGDTLYYIGQRYNVSLEDILQLNPGIVNPEQLEAGYKLKIPTSEPVAIGYGRMEIMHQHVVKQGDTLWKLSKAWGVPLAAMVHANPHLKNPNVLLTGEIVNIPKADSVVPSGGPTASSAASSGTHPLHPSKMMQGMQQGVQGIVGKLQAAQAVGKTLTGLATGTGKKNTAPIADKKPTGPIVSPVPPAPEPPKKTEPPKVEPKAVKPEPKPSGKIEPLAEKKENIAPKIEPQSTKKVEPLATKVQPQSTKVEPLATKVQPQATKVEPLSTKTKPLPQPLGANVQPLSANPQPLGANVQPLSANPQPLGANVQPLGANVQPLGANVQPLGANVQPLGANVQPLGANVQPLGANVQPLGANVQPLGANPQPLGANVQPLSANPQPLGANIQPLSANPQPLGANIAPLSANPGPVAAGGYAGKAYGKKALPIEKAAETKVKPLQSDYIQSVDLFQQSNIPATDAVAPYDWPALPNMNMPYSPAQAGNNSGIQPLSNAANVGPGFAPAPYGANANPPLMPLSAGPGWGYGNPMINAMYQGMSGNPSYAPLSNNAPNAGMMPLSNAPNTGAIAPLSAMYPPASYDNNFAGIGYPPYAPYPTWPGAQGTGSGTDDCNCNGKRDDDLSELELGIPSAYSKSGKPAKKKKKAVIRTVAPRPKKRQTYASRPWLNT